jgi:hypothetical protein
MRDLDGGRLEKWTRVRISSNYDRTLPIWIIPKPTLADFEGNKLWIYCEKCAQLEYLKAEFAEFRKFVDDHASLHPQRVEFQISKRLARFQNFDSRQISFDVADRVPKAKNLPLGTKVTDFSAHLGNFLSKVVRGTEVDDCWIFVDGTKPSQYYHRDTFTYQSPVVNRVSGRESYKLEMFRPAVFAWISQVGPLPKEMRLNNTCDNEHCVRLDHLQLVKRDQPLIDSLHQMKL